MKKIITLFLILVILVVVIFLSRLNQKPARPTPNNLPVIQSSLKPTQSPLITNNPLYPYLTTKINQTGEGELQSLPNFKTKSVGADGTSQYLYSSDFNNRDDLIIVNQGVVVFERRITRVENDKLPLLSDFSSKYGPAAVEKFGPIFYGDFVKTYVYPDKGFALVANPYLKEVGEVQTFVPMTAEQYLNTWGKELKDQPNIHGD